MSQAGEIVGHKIKAGTKNARRYEFDCIATEAISADDIVYISSLSGERWKVTKAVSTTYASANGLLLIAKHKVASGGRGRFAIIGTIDNYNTAALAVGDPVYLSSTSTVSLTKGSGEGRVVGTVAVSSSTVGQIVFNGLAGVGGPRRAGSSPAASSAITGATETQTNFSTGSVTLAANQLRVGTIVRLRARGIYTATTGAEVHVLGVAIAGTSIAASGNIDPIDNDVFDIEFEFTVRAIGASGTITGSGVVRSGPRATAAPATHLIATGSAGTSTATIDTTAALAISIYVDRQAGATDSDSMRLDSYTIEIIG